MLSLFYVKICSIGRIQIPTPSPEVTDRHFNPALLQWSRAVAFSGELWLNWNASNPERTELSVWSEAMPSPKTCPEQTPAKNPSVDSSPKFRFPSWRALLLWGVEDVSQPRSSKKPKSHLPANDRNLVESFPCIHYFASLSWLLLYNNRFLGTQQGLEVVRRKKKFFFKSGGRTNTSALVCVHSTA